MDHEEFLDALLFFDADQSMPLFVFLFPPVVAALAVSFLPFPPASVALAVLFFPYVVALFRPAFVASVVLFRPASVAAVVLFRPASVAVAVLFLPDPVAAFAHMLLDVETGKSYRSQKPYRSGFLHEKKNVGAFLNRTNNT